MRFKVGDKVRTKQEGAVGTVTATNADTNFPIEVCFDNGSYDITEVFAEDSLELHATERGTY